MTRETALRWMLTGKKVEHPNLSEYYFEYVAILHIPIIKCRKADDKFVGESHGSLLPFTKGWKEYREENNDK